MEATIKANGLTDRCVAMASSSIRTELSLTKVFGTEECLMGKEPSIMITPTTPNKTKESITWISPLPRTNACHTKVYSSMMKSTELAV